MGGEDELGRHRLRGKLRICSLQESRNSPKNFYFTPAAANDASSENQFLHIPGSGGYGLILRGQLPPGPMSPRGPVAPAPDPSGGLAQGSCRRLTTGTLLPYPADPDSERSSSTWAPATGFGSSQMLSAFATLDQMGLDCRAPGRKDHDSSPDPGGSASPMPTTAERGCRHERRRPLP